MDPTVISELAAHSDLIINNSRVYAGWLGMGLLLPLSAIGSAWGITIVGTAAAGAWKKCYQANKPAPMTLIALCGMPISQVLYGFILLMQMMNVEIHADNAGIMLAFGVGTGVALAFSAIGQGKIAAAACDSLADNGKGFVNFVTVLGIIETVALFAMVFTMINLPS